MKIRIESTYFPVVDEPLAYELENRADIDAHYAEFLKKKPRTWNGPFFLFTDVGLSDDKKQLHGKAHRTDFATYLYLRRVKRDARVTHITGTSLMVTTDQAIVAMRMAQHTVNAGHVYYPAGSFDPLDVVEGQLDPLTNVRRELLEEVGLDLPEEMFATKPVAAYHDNTWHVAPFCQLPYDFSQVQTLFSRHQQETGDDELSELIAIRAEDEIEHIKPFAQLLAEWMFDNLHVLESDGGREKIAL